jgi:DNA-binding MurR/RpiR family transcriptional regulator
VTDGPPADESHVLQQIARRLPYLNPALRRVAEFILERPGTAKTMTITELAAASDVAESTVSRFVKQLGLGRYPSLRVGIAEALLLDRPNGAEPDRKYVYEGISQGDSSATIIGKITGNSHQALRKTGAGLDAAAIDRAVDLIDSANVIIFCCMGSSSIAAEDAVTRFTRAGKKCLLFRDQSLQVMTATIVTPDDVVIGISDSGESTPVVEALAQARKNGAPTIGVTSAEGSRLCGHATVTLYTSTATPIRIELYGEAMTGKWGQILVMDVLYAAFAVRHFDETLRHLEDTYATGIRTSRAVPQS